MPLGVARNSGGTPYSCSSHDPGGSDPVNHYADDWTGKISRITTENSVPSRYSVKLSPARHECSKAGERGKPSPAPTTSPQPKSNADMNKGGANNGGDCGAYCSTRDGSASGNGVGDGNATGKPCAGCVGKADNKNPKGQAPNGSDHNAGYECDRNNGIGKTNPAHTGCSTANWQFDFAVGPVLGRCSGPPRVSTSPCSTRT